MEINSLDNLIKSTEDWNLFVFLELEGLLFPNSLNVVELGFDLGLLLGSVNELSNLLRELVELELDKVIKAELW